MKEPNLDHVQVEHIEVERAEYKAIVRRALTDLFQDVLGESELEQRLAMVDEVTFVTRAQMDAIAKNNPREAGADGLIQYDVSDTGVRRIPVVLHTASRVATLHTLLHEVTHLMTPKSVIVSNPIAEVSEGTFSDYLGALWFQRDIQTKEIDFMSLTPDAPSRFLFWEAVTDWLAETGLGNEITEQEREEIATSGYFERHWIDYLLRQSPDPSALIKAIKESYTTGTEDPFRWCLHEQIGINNDDFYDELLKITGRKRTDETRVDDWISTVDAGFKKTT